MPDVAVLRRLVAWLLPIIVVFATYELVVGIVFADERAALASLLLATYGAAMVIGLPRLGTRTDATVFVIAGGMLGLIGLGAAIQPFAAPMLGIALLLPVIVAVPFLAGWRLLGFMAVAWFTGLWVALVAAGGEGGSGLPAPAQAALGFGLASTATALVLYLLWHLGEHLNATIRDMRASDAMSRDLALTLDPQEVGDRMAAHLARATGATEAGICFWDRDGDRVLTYGYYPFERRKAVADEYRLAEYPETLLVLERQREALIRVDDRSADPSEVAYLESLGVSQMAMLPLVARGRSIGTVELMWAPKQPLPERTLPRARALVAAAAVALDNARLHAELQQAALQDQLTGLPNRVLFRDRLEHALARTARNQSGILAVMILDIDNFATVNDNLGHSAADELLVQVAGRLAASIRPGDTVARLDGDEFAILFDQLSHPDQALQLAERLLDAVRATNHRATLDASVGVGWSRLPAKSVDRLLSDAAFALDQAKRGGKGQVRVLEPRQRAEARQHTETESRLRRALERSEFELAYQPIIELRTGRLAAMEALLRWRRTGRGAPLLPGDFIPIAEETGLIVPIGRWVMKQACEQLASWQIALGPHAPSSVTINLSARQLQDAQLLADIHDATARAGISPDRLTLEITETALIEPDGPVTGRLEELRRLGVRLAIDDFGVGYSSLSYLQHFPVQQLKIDRSFLVGTARSDILMRAIFELGKALRFELVAEGIERPDQVEMLIELGCQYGQGFLLSAPMPPNRLGPELTRWSGRWKRIRSARTTPAAASAETLRRRARPQGRTSGRLRTASG